MTSSLIPSPEAHQASEQLDSFVRENNIVLIQQLQAWYEENKTLKEPFERQVLRHYTAINENTWIDKVTKLAKRAGGISPYYPCLFPDGVCAAALTPLGRDLAQQFFAAIIHDSPIMVVGLLNPFLSHEIYKQLSFQSKHENVVFVSITPHQFQHYLALQVQNRPIVEIDWSKYSVATWAKHCQLDGALFPSTDSLVDSLWRNTPRVPILYPHMYAQAVCSEKAFHFAVRQTATYVWVATTTATQLFLDEMFQFYAGKEVFLLSIPQEEASRLLHAAQEAKLIEGYKLDVDISEPLVVRDWHTEKNNEPQVWQQMLHRAIAIGASDIVLEPSDQSIRVRFAVNGSYIEQAPLTLQFYERMSTRIKVVGNMESGVKGQSQTGRGDTMYQGMRYDQRYSIAVLEGNRECVCVRIHSSRVPSLSDLNLAGREAEILQWFLSLDRGMMICTGPTGSGKSTTLYACINHLIDPRRRIITIEDPVEKKIPQISQIGIHPKANITFETALRDTVRQAPNIIMLGEIRDRESAISAFDAAATGHLLLTTLHTDDAPGTIGRLTGPRFAVDRNTISLALRLVINQALLPRLCPACRRTRPATHHDTVRFPDVPVSDPVISEQCGCTLCRGTGVQGRIAIMEMMPVDAPMKAKIESGATSHELRQYNKDRGYLDLAQQATRFMLEGEISVETASRYLSTTIRF